MHQQLPLSPAPDKVPQDTAGRKSPASEESARQAVWTIRTATVGRPITLVNG
ncbi:hypothetical protein [Streptomyces sp. AD55]|uniref:hypothetical protein n=1 Tax=Streptomyces sp. AD55 TaxID=3242895 RepID=UPI0035283564